MYKWIHYHHSFQSNKDIKCLFDICSPLACKYDYSMIFSTQYAWKEWTFPIHPLWFFLSHSGPFYCQSNKIYNEKKIQILFFLISLYIWNSSRFTVVWMWLKAEICLEIFVGFQKCSKNNYFSCVKIQSPKPKKNVKQMDSADIDMKHHFSFVNSAFDIVEGRSGYIICSKMQNDCKTFIYPAI